MTKKKTVPKSKCFWKPENASKTKEKDDSVCSTEEQEPLNVDFTTEMWDALLTEDPTENWGFQGKQNEDERDEPQPLPISEIGDIILDAMTDEDILEELRCLEEEDREIEEIKEDFELPSNSNTTTHRADGLRKSVAEIIHGGVRKQSKRKYNNYWRMYLKYANERSQTETSDITVMHFFVDMLEKKKFGLGSVFSIYACVNAGFQREFGINLNQNKELMKLLINLTKYYQPTKTRILTEHEMEKVFTEIFDPKKHDDLLYLVTIALMYYGLLRQNEVHAIKVQDVTIVEDKKIIHVNFPNPTKSRARGFAFTIPPELYDVFITYLKQLRAKDRQTLANSQFLKNAQKSGIRKQNMGRDRHNIILKRISDYFGFDKRLTSHTWRRSAATILANSGISVLGLKRAGRWKNLESAEHYIEHSQPVLIDWMKRLSKHAREEKEEREEFGTDGEKIVAMMTVSLLHMFSS